MKKILVVVSCTIQAAVYSQSSHKFCRGYICSSEGDTVFTKIIIENTVKNIELSDLYQKVVYVSNDNQLDTAYPGKSKIMGYGFQKDTGMYHFIRVKTGKKGKKDIFKYAWRILDGYAKLYSYAYDFVGMKTTYQNGWAHGDIYRNKSLNYYLQKGASEAKFVPQRQRIFNDEKWLKDFFKDDETLRKKIGKEIKSYDLEAMVNEYNAWYSSRQEN